MDYGEILCQAMDLIAGKNTEQIKFDTTKVCTIIDDSLKQQGKYTVDEGTVSYTAFSNITTYQKDDVVYVQIPEGNYDEQKIIIGKKLKSNETSYNYISPFDNFIGLDETKIKIKEEINGLIANGEIQKQEIYSEDFSADPKTAYTRLGIAADFTALLEQDLSSGNYGLIVQLSNEKEVVENFVLDCQDMNGFIYSFLEPTRQEFLFDISSIISKITKIQVYFYQMSNFKNKEKIKVKANNDTFNLFVQNLEISFGIEIDNSKKENLILFTKDSLYYGDDNQDKRTVELRWVHLKDDKTRIFLPKELGKNGIDEQYELKWYKYKTGEEGDSVSGQNWLLLENKENFSYSFTPDVVNNTEEKFKVVLVQYAEDKTINSFYTSNFITFVNKEEIVNKSTLDSVYGLTLKPEDGSQGSYFLYDFAHNIYNNSNVSQARKLQCYFKEKSEESKETILSSAEELRWIIPIQNSMLKFSNYLYYPYYSLKETKNKNFLEEKKIGNGEIYGVINPETNLVDTYYENKNGTAVEAFKNNELTILINSKKSNEKQLEVVPINDNLTYLPYYIKAQYQEQYINNTVTCYFKKGRKTYQDKFSFAFGIATNNGTDSNLILKLIDGECSIQGQKYKCKPYINGNSLKSEINYIGIEAQIFDSQGKEITDYTNITFNFSLYNPYNANSNTNISLASQYTENNKIVFKVKTDTEFSSNAIDIIACQVKGLKNYNLNTCLGIPIKYSDTADYEQILGPEYVMIDTGGQATYEKINYILIDKKGQTVYPSGLRWRMISELKKKDDKAEFEKFYPQIEEPKQFYETVTFNSNTTFDFESNYKIYYEDIQPIYSIDYDKTEETIIPITAPIVDSENNIQYAKYNGIIFLSGADDKEIKKYIARHENEKDNFIITLMERELKPSELVWNLKVYDLILDNCPKLAIQAYAQEETADGQNEKIYFQKPLIIMHNTWISKIINEWDGKTLGINEEEGYLLGKMLAAGSKNEDNEFSGVILGDWKNTDTQEVLTKNTGLYGFHEGIMSFYFKDDGTAAIGKKGVGQIQFNGNKGTIQSGIYELSKGSDGAYIDFVKGQIILANNKEGKVELNASEETIFETEILDEQKGLIGIKAEGKDKDGIYLIKNEEKGQWNQIEYLKENGQYTGNFIYKTDSSGDYLTGTPIYKSGFPIKVGKLGKENFKVAWDGSVFANNGRFSGTIHANGGTINGNMLVNGVLKGATIESGNFNAQLTLNGIWQDYYDLVIADDVDEAYDTEIIKDGINKGYKYWRKVENDYVELKNEEDKKDAYENEVLYERIFYWVPGVDENEEKTNYFPITFDMIDSNAEITKDLVQMGMLRVFDGEKSNIFGIKTIDSNNSNIQTNIGFDSGSTLRAHGKRYSGLSVGNTFNDPTAQIGVQTQPNGNTEIILNANKILLEKNGQSPINLFNSLDSILTKEEIVSIVIDTISGMDIGGDKGGN